MTHWWAIVYFLVCGLIPCALVYVSYEKATTYLSLYSPLFLYPLFYGWIAALLMQQAYQSHLSGVLAAERRKLAFWGGVLVFTVIFFCLEVIGPDHIWEAPPSAVDGDPFLRDFLESTAHSPDDKQQYQTKLAALIGGVGNWHNWPATRWAYFVSVLGQASLLLVIFASCAVLSFHRLSERFKHSPTANHALVQTALAAAVSLLWILMRAAYEAQRELYQAAPPSPIALHVFVALFLIAGLFIAAYLWLWLGENLTGVIIGLLTIIGAVVGLVRPSVLVACFGKDAGLVPYITILVGMGVLAWTWLMLRPRAGGELDDSNV